MKRTEGLSLGLAGLLEIGVRALDGVSAILQNRFIDLGRAVAAEFGHIAGIRHGATILINAIRSVELDATDEHT